MQAAAFEDQLELQVFEQEHEGMLGPASRSNVVSLVWCDCPSVQLLWLCNVNMLLRLVHITVTRPA